MGKGELVVGVVMEILQGEEPVEVYEREILWREVLVEDLEDYYKEKDK